MNKLPLQINNCPCTLEPGCSTYSKKGLRQLYNSKAVEHTLKYYVHDAKKEQRKLLNENRTRISISGVQKKFLFKLQKKELILAETDGTYILKPIPNDLENVEHVPANEHVTMQIASQVYKLNVAKNALIFFADNEPAYITKRFDVLPNGLRCLKEDFASLLQKTSQGGNKNFKYNSSYLEMANAIDKYLPTAIVSKEALYKLIIFNYLFSNGDAHLKNFSVIDYQQDGFYQLAPAYDLLCTRLHIDDGDFALSDALYDGDHTHDSYRHYGFHAYQDFYDFGLKIGLQPKRIEQFLELFTSKTSEVKSIVARSFLSAAMQELYLEFYTEKLKRLCLKMP
jgi:serine/threonine-protein kinase HipA